MKRFWLVFILAAPVLILTGCGINFLNGPDISFSTNPGSLGYEETQQGIVIGERNLTFSSRAGAMGVTLREYRIEFVDQNGFAINGGDNDQEGSLNIYVPPGIRCEDPDPNLGCTVNSTGATFVEGEVVTTEQGYQLLPIEVATDHIAAGYPIGWQARITFKGVATTGRDHRQTFMLPITPPN